MSQMAHRPIQRRLLMETLAGHIALLTATHPKKAKSVITKRARQCVMLSLRQSNSRRAA